MNKLIFDDELSKLVRVFTCSSMIGIYKILDDKPIEIELSENEIEEMKEQVNERLKNEYGMEIKDNRLVKTDKGEKGNDTHD